MHHWLRIILPGLVLGSAFGACTEENPYINVCDNTVVEEANSEGRDDGDANNDSYGRTGYSPEVDDFWTFADLGIVCFGLAHFC